MKEDNKTKKQLIHELTELRSKKAALEKSESAEKYRSLVENIRDVIYELDSQGVVLYISPTIRDLLGYDSAEIVGKNFIELAYKDDQGSLSEWFSELRKGREYPSEYRMSNKSGELIWARTKTRPIVDDGLFKGAYGILIDVTAQRRVEEKLRESEEYFKAIIQNSSDIILIVDKLGNITYTSPPIERFLGYRPDELIGKRTLDLIVSDDKPKAIADFGKALLTREVPIPNVFRIRHKDGTERILEGIGKNLLDNPIVKGFVMNVRDITERKQAENALREAEDRYRELTDFLPISISTFEVDAAGTIISYNRTALETFKYNEEDYKEGMNALQFFAPEEWQRVGENIGKVIQGTSIPGQEFTFLRKDGSKFPGLIYASPNIQQNKTVGIRGVIIDITERKQAEEASRDAEAHYHVLFDQSPNGILLIDSETGNTIEANETAYKQLGYTREEFAALRISDYEALEKPEETIKHIRKVIHDGSDDFQTLHRTKSGEIRNIHVWTKTVQLSNRIFIYTIFEDITDRKRLEEEERRNRKAAERLAEEMSVIADIGRVIGSTLEIDKVYEQAATEIGKLITFDNLVVNLFNAQQETLNVEYVSGLDIPGRRVGESYSVRGTVWNESFRMRKGMIVQLDNPEDFTEKFPSLIVSVRAGILSVMSIPLITNNEVIGNLIMRSKKSVAYTEQDLRLAEKIGMAIAGAIANARLFSERKQTEEKLQHSLESLRKAFGTTIQVMVSAVEVRDPYTSGHQIRSADLARAIAIEMGLPQNKIDAIRMAGSIHDIGKLSIPAEILSKPTKLSEIEFSLIKAHAQRGFEMLKDVESPWPLADIVYQHHERIDGSGYPRNLKGDNILIEARILCVADVVEAMASHRPYRPGLGIDAALQEIEKNKGIFYDNAVADACLRLFREKGFKLEGIEYK